MPIVNYTDEHQTLSCQRTMTLKQIVILLTKQPCAQIIEKEDQRQVNKRNTDAGNVDIHALQTTINDHRTMINYLINNSINATYVSDAITNHHSKTGPILNSWRDIIDLCTVTLSVGFIIYYCICRTGCTTCDKVLSYCCKPIITRIREQEQPQTIANQKTPRKMRQRQRAHSPMASIENDIRQYHHGYITD
ncbi:unnamed protein product [Adineta steineri]|uniref:Uncharacterized protein n=1 Tax=Adineta steineri TaxID=433720 RepID=A0A819JS95_9BILA|nr:unnamed protein product [Adineta steineri]CAF3932286.1 unnamed protein product [Adineta steineri]